MIPMKISFSVRDKRTDRILSKEETSRKGFYLNPLGNLVRFKFTNGEEIVGGMNEVTDHVPIYYVSLPKNYEIVEKE